MRSTRQDRSSCVRGSEEDSLTRLLNGSVDYTLMDDLVVQYIVSNYPKESETKLQIGVTPLINRGLYLALRRTRPDAESIIKGFNAQLKGMIADGTYHRLLHVDWIQADLNGDGKSRQRAAEQQGRYLGAPARLLAVLEYADGVSVNHQARFLYRRQYLQRLGERARQLQGNQLAAAGSTTVLGNHLQVHVLIDYHRPFDVRLKVAVL